MDDVRPLHPSDLDLVCEHRTRMFKEAGFALESLAAMAEPFRCWLAPQLQQGRYFGWIVEADGVPIAGLGMMVIDWPPHPSHPAQDRRGYILNLFVEPAHRHGGLATQLLKIANEEAKRRGIVFMVLHATELGRPIYERLGWRRTTEMAISLV